MRFPYTPFYHAAYLVAVGLLALYTITLHRRRARVRERLARLASRES